MPKLQPVNDTDLCKMRVRGGGEGGEVRGKKVGSTECRSLNSSHPVTYLSTFSSGRERGLALDRKTSSVPHPAHFDYTPVKSIHKVYLFWPGA